MFVRPPVKHIRRRPDNTALEMTKVSELRSYGRPSVYEEGVLGGRNRRRGGLGHRLAVPVSALLIATALFAVPVAAVFAPVAEASPQSPPFSECPLVGDSASCEALIDITSSGVTIYTDPSVGPYDDDDDELIGVLNQSGVAVSSFGLSSPNGIYGFDGDGVCDNPNSSSGLSLSPAVATECAGNTRDTSDGLYGGPDAYFTSINTTTYESGTVNFISPIAVGASAFFSLETSLGSATVTVAAPQTAPVHVSPVGSVTLSSFYGGHDETAPCTCGTTVIAQPAGIDPGTGDLVESYQDISVPGAGIPLLISRTYDSGLAQQEVLSGTATEALGYGWSYNLGMSLSVNSTSHVATINQDNGSQVSFSPYVSGSSPAWCTGSTNYCANAPRDLGTLENNTNGSWTFVRYSGGHPMTFNFSSSGVLTGEQDQAGDSLTSASEAAGAGACPSTATGCTLWTSSASGRSLTLAFDSSGRLSSATDGAGNTVSYCYFGQSCASGVTDGGPHDIYSVAVPGGATTTYGYDSSNSTASFDHDLLSEGWPSGGTVTNTYNSSGQVASQNAPTADITLSYSGNNLSYSGGSTVVSTWPTGTSGSLPAQVVDYQYSSGYLVAETTGYGTSSAATEYFDLDPTSLVPTLVQRGDTYQSQDTVLTATATPLSIGDVTLATDGVGDVTAYQYNANNQVWCEVSPSEYLDSITCPSSEPSSPPAAGASDPYLGATINFYNSNGQLTATTDPLGNTTTYSYTSGVSGVPNGLQYCSVDPVDYQKSVTCPAYGSTHVTGTTTSTFDSAGDETSATDADGNKTLYYYAVSGHPGLLSSSVSPDGTTTSYTYNSAGLVLSQTVSFASYSATTLSAYNTAGEQYCSVAPHEYALGVTCPSSPPSSPPTPGHDSYLGAAITTFDAAGRPVQVTNPLGGISYTAYDQAGNVYCTVAPAEAADSVTCPSSPPTSPPTLSSDPYLGATITTYDTFGRPVQVTDPLGGITLTTYDADNNVTETTTESNNSTADPNVVTMYTYDADDRVVSTTVDPGGSLAATTSQAYDPNGNVYCSASADAFASDYQCPAWQPGWAAEPPSPSSLYSTAPYAAQANNTITSFYNADGEQLQTTNPDIDMTISALDGDGRTYCTSDPTNVSAWLTAHSSGTYPYLCPSSPPSSPPAGGSNPGYVTTIYDAAGNQLSTTDQVGDTTSYTYGPGGQVLTTTDPRGKVTTNCYYYQDGGGQCAAAAPSGGGSGADLFSTTTPTTSADPSGETTTFTYYPGDEADVTTNPAGTTTDAYDAAGDLTSVSYSSVAAGYATPVNVSYTYNPDQSRATMSDATGTTSYSYDAMGDLKSAALVAGTGSGLSNETTSYGYFSTGVAASVTYPSYGSYSSPEVSYDYDATGAMASETDWLGNTVSFAHDQTGNQTGQDNDVSTSNPSGTSSTSWAYDDAGYNTSATSTLAQTCGGAEALTQSFSPGTGSRNPDGQVTQDEESYTSSCSGQGSYQRDYSYDLAGRVVYEGASAQGGNANNFGYDASGDPTTFSAHDSSGNFDTYTEAFDNAGELTSQAPVSGSSGTTSNYTFDTLGDQTSASAATGSGTSYGYNSLGEMTSTSGGTSASTLVPGDLYTLAGSAGGVEGHSGDTGSATSALLGHVNDVVADSSGNLYIADTSNNRVQEVAATTHTQFGVSMTAGDIYTIAGSASGTSGSSGDGGVATSALLSSPTGVALDSSDNLYIADQANNRVQFVAAAACSSSCPWGLSSTGTGDIYTIAGTGTAGHTGDGGAATSAHLDLPTGVALDSSGNLYIADQYNNRVQFVAAASCSSSCRWGLSATITNDIYTIAGSASGTSGHSGDGSAATSALLDGPDALSLDSSGNLYIADAGNSRVQFVAAAACTTSCPLGLSSTTANDIYTIAGSATGSSGSTGDGSAATSALLDDNWGVAVDSSGDLYIGDTDNNRVQFVAASSCSSSCPWGLSATTKGDIYTIAGSATGSGGEAGERGPATSALLDGVTGLGLDASGNLLLADPYNYEVQLVPTSACSASCSWAPFVTTTGHLYPAAGSVEGTEGHSGNSGPATDALMGEVNDVVADSSGNLYIADTSNNRAQEVSATSHTQFGISMTAGDIYTIAGSASGTSGSSGDGGVATSALLSSPTGVALDSSGNLYIADQANNRVQFVAAGACTSSCPWGLSTTGTGDIYTIAGTGTAGHSGDGGAATSAHLDLPTGVALDSSGNLYIADQYNNRVQFVAVASCSSSCRWGLSSTTAHDIYTIAGSASGTEGHSGDGSAATSALLNDPSSVVLDSAGNLYIADTDNNRVQFVAVASCSSSCPLGLSSTAANDIYTVAGSASGSSGDSGNGGAATSALLSSPSGLALNSAGNVFVADGGNNRVQLVAAATCSSLCPLGITSTTKGDIYTVAGSATGADGESGLGGLATSAVLNGVAGVGTDSAGDLYVADTYNYEVDEVPTTSTGSVTSSYSYNGDGLEASHNALGVLSQYTWGEVAGSGLPVVISDSANDYVYGPSGTPVEQVALATSTPTYLTYTPSDSSWLSTNQAGDETGFWRYDAFGTLVLGTPTSPFGYSGQYTDASTGFVNDSARWYDPGTGEFMSVDPDLAVTNQPYAYAGDDPVNEADPSGLYSYSYYWDLGWLGQPGNVFDFFLAHPKEVFPFSTGRCSTFYVNEKCEFRPEGTQDNLFVKSIDRSFREFEYDNSALEVTDNTLTLEVLKWCTAGVPGLFCIAGDPPHSTISFSILDIPAAAVSQKSCSGDVDVLEQHADAPNASFITNAMAPPLAELTWESQAKNLVKALGGDPSNVALLTGPGWSS